jgi:RHS repeat-associated protein
MATNDDELRVQASLSGTVPRRLVGWALGVLVLLVGCMAWSVPVASAESLCTDTWVGPAEGEWSEAAGWSGGHVPSSADVACIGAGKTVKVTGSTAAVAGVVQGAGTLVLQAEGSLEVSNSLETSVIGAFTQTGGTLTGAGSLQVSGSLSWTGGVMGGSGQTVVKAGAIGTLSNTNNKYLSARSLINEGTTTFSEGQVWTSSGARITNVGAFNANSQYGIVVSSGSETSIVNTGTFEKTSGTGATGIDPNFESTGTIAASAGTLQFTKSLTLSSGKLEGQLNFNASTTASGSVSGEAATVTVPLNTSFTVNSGGIVTLGTLTLNGGIVRGGGTLAISRALTWNGGQMADSGTTVIESGATSEWINTSSFLLTGTRTFVNEGTVTTSVGQLWMYENTKLENFGTIKENGGERLAMTFPSGATPVIVNYGLFEKTAGSGITTIGPWFRNEGRVTWIPETSIYFPHPILNYGEMEMVGEENPSAPNREPAICGEDVNCATGNLSKSQTDFSIGGRGVGLDLTRTYNSQAAANGIQGIFGYGWSSSFGDHLAIETTQKRATLTQANGSMVVFTEGTGGSYAAPAWSQDSLTGSEAAGYTVTLPDQTVYRFSGTTGRLESVTDRAGNATTIAYNAGGKPETITDPAGRTLKLAYNAEGLVESATDPMGHAVKYTYEGGSLASVTQPAEAALRWRFKYDASHQLTELVDGREGKTSFEYSAGHQVVKETDPLLRVTKFEYQQFQTLTKNEATGAMTADSITSSGLASAVTSGYGTSQATTESMTYDGSQNLLTRTDGDGHTTKYTYDSHGNKTSQTDPEGNKTEWTYNSTHDVLTETKPNRETTTYEPSSYDPARVSRPAPEGKTQESTFEYNTHGQVVKMTDPLAHVWTYGYDSYGDKNEEVDPEGDKRTWEYNADSYETATVSPRGNVTGGEPLKFTTRTERDAQGRPVKITDPLGHETTYKYDANGNLEAQTDPEGHTTTYTYDADNERTKTKEANGTVTETGYDGASQVTSQIDGNKHTTTYKRNVLEQVVEVVDPLARKTVKEYDAADALNRTTKYRYNTDNRLVEVTYSDGKTPTVKYEYNADGLRTKMVDGTGTTTYEYDQLDRMIESKDGHGNLAKYEYNLANQQTKIVYPNGKAVTHAFDNTGRLVSVTDWSGRTTKFGYDQNSNQTTTAFPTGTGNEDLYTFNNADELTKTEMKKGTETLASLAYTRTTGGLVEASTQKGLPGEEKVAYAYDPNRRLTKGGTIAYEYDPANNPTKIGSSTDTYNAADELEKGTNVTYAYNETGERTKTTPTTGSATTYTYDQAGNLLSVEKPKEGRTPAIEDKYAYNGDGLRASRTASATTTYLAWDFAEKLPLVLNDGTNSFIYGPEGIPIEQINSKEEPTYLHHDQQGSTRLLTGATGTVLATMTYDAYGNLSGHTGTATTPLGYDGQYTDSDTGLIYLRARSYDPATAQFLSVDPAGETTQAPYAYASDNPLNIGDPTGLTPWSPKVRQAIAKCRGWRAWHSKKSPFYGNRNVYIACQDLLHLPREVYGTGRKGKAGRETAACLAGATGGALVAVYGSAGLAGEAGAIAGCAIGVAIVDSV